MSANYKEFGELFFAIARMWRLRLDARLREDARLAPFNLSLAKWRVLLRLQRSAEGLSQRQLADLVGVEGATMVGLIDRLEADGLVERRACSGDRRSKIVHLLPAGEALAPFIEAHAEAVRSEIFGAIPDVELGHCHQVLVAMHNTLQSSNGPEQE